MNLGQKKNKKLKHGKQEDKYKKNVKKGLTDDDYRLEIDNLFKAIKKDWDINSESKFFDPHDKPGFIEIFGSERERIQMVKLYLDNDGDLIGGDGLDVDPRGVGFAPLGLEAGEGFGVGAGGRGGHRAVFIPCHGRGFGAVESPKRRGQQCAK